MDEITLVYESLLKAHAERRPCALATVVGTTGSIPRAMGAKMLIYPDRRIVGSVGGGKFESLVIDDALQALGAGDTVFKSYPLHEGDSHSFGAICGGDVRILIEPQRLREALVLIGAGHCSRAIASLAVQCGLAVTVVDDRAELLADFPATHLVNDR
ncbi:MAG: XdhC family protein, partial [Verrucomicrobiota bacterium]